MSKWFYHYKINGEVAAVAGPFDSQEECSTQRETHRTEKPEDQCGSPTEQRDNYQHEFYGAGRQG